MNIEIAIPKQTFEIEYLLKILDKIYKQRKDSTSVITFSTKPIADPQINIRNLGTESANFNIGGLPISFNSEITEKNQKPSMHPEIKTQNDNNGEYLEVKWPGATYNQLSFKQLHERIGKDLTYLDHVGININPRLLPRSCYVHMKEILSESGYLWDFVSREWSFLVFDNNPKFEFVYDFQHFYPEIQIDIQTDIEPRTLISMFPQPYGYYDPTPFYGDYCVSTFIYTGWSNTSLRADLRFKVPNFDHTQWLHDNCRKVEPKG